MSKCCCLLIGFNESIGVPVLDAPSGKVSDIDIGWSTVNGNSDIESAPPRLATLSGNPVPGLISTVSDWVESVCDARTLITLGKYLKEFQSNLLPLDFRFKEKF